MMNRIYMVILLLALSAGECGTYPRVQGTFCRQTSVIQSGQPTFGCVASLGL